MKHFMLFLILLISVTFATGQDLLELVQSGNQPSTPKSYMHDNVFDLKIQNLKNQSVTQIENLFTVARTKSKDFSKYVHDGIPIELDIKSIQQISKTKSNALRLKIPVDQKYGFHLLLQKADIISENFSITNASGKPIGAGIDYGVHYHGVVEGDHASYASVSIAGDEIQIIIADKNGNYNLNQVQKGQYLLYNDLKLKSKPGFTCGNEHDVPNQKQRERIQNLFDDHGNLKTKRLKIRDRIEIIIELDNDMWNGLGDNVANCFNYAIHLARNAADVYERDGMSLRLNNVIIWQDSDPADPFNGGSLSDDLDDWARDIRTSFNADMIHYLRNNTSGDPGSTGGVAQGIGGICDQASGFLDNTSAHCVTQGVPLNYEGTENNLHDDIEDNEGGFLAPTRFLKVFCHESGHVLGSYHTHACEWNGNSTQIDDCGNKDADDEDEPIEGSSCYNANNLVWPTNGGTIMSYCDRFDVDINLVDGFHPQTASMMRSTIDDEGCFDTYEESCPEVEVIEGSIGSVLSGLVYDAEDDLIVYDSDIIITPQSITLTAGSETIIRGDFTCPPGAGFVITTTGCTNN